MGLVGKLIHEATSSLKEGEPSSSSKTIKLLINKIGLLLSNLSLDKTRGYKFSKGRRTQFCV